MLKFAKKTNFRIQSDIITAFAPYQNGEKENHKTDKYIFITSLHKKQIQVGNESSGSEIKTLYK